MNQEPTELLLKSIGTFESEQIEAYQAGRQPDSFGLTGKIHLHAGNNFEQALEDLAGCTHLWIIFGFHLNSHWKPLVQTPRSTKKIGVFATRAPYRPNPLGLSLVKLISLNGLTIEIAENDLLNGSPIYDIKPYHPEHDVAAEAEVEWLKKSTHSKNNLYYSPLATAQLDFLENKKVYLRAFITRQLEYDPINNAKKRVETSQHGHTLSYRTWRIDFTLVEDTIGILAIRSAYTTTELNTNEKDYSDPYQDKDLHRHFNLEFL